MTWIPKPDDDGRLYPSYVVTIRRNADGVERQYLLNGEWHSSSWYWWTDGNAGCDCNRYLMFERAGGGEPENENDDYICSDGKYSVLRFDFPDGTFLKGPDA